VVGSKPSSSPTKPPGTSLTAKKGKTCTDIGRAGTGGLVCAKNAAGNSVWMTLAEKKTIDVAASAKAAEEKKAADKKAADEKKAADAKAAADAKKSAKPEDPSDEIPKNNNK
jgi:membrane protein involved in colicin uptake